MPSITTAFIDSKDVWKEEILSDELMTQEEIERRKIKIDEMIGAEMKIVKCNYCKRNVPEDCMSTKTMCERCYEDRQEYEAEMAEQRVKENGEIQYD
jgi:hypothetical protein